MQPKCALVQSRVASAETAAARDPQVGVDSMLNTRHSVRSRNHDGGVYRRNGMVLFELLALTRRRDAE